MSDLKLKPARRERLADALYGQILEQLTDGTLKEGDKLPSEAEIGLAFGVSRPVVRQALSRLRADGLVVAQRGAGTFVKTRPPRLTDFAPAADIASFIRSFEVRIAVESEGARLAAGRRSQKELQALQSAMEALEAAFSEGARGEGEDFAFHLALMRASGNPLFVELLEYIHKAVMGSMTMALGVTRLGSAERRRQVLAEHHRILEAVIAQDADSAELYARYHLTQARARVTDVRRDL